MPARNPLRLPTDTPGKNALYPHAMAKKGGRGDRNGRGGRHGDRDRDRDRNDGDDHDRDDSDNSSGWGGWGGWGGWSGGDSSSDGGDNSSGDGDDGSDSASNDNASSGDNSGSDSSGGGHGSKSGKSGKSKGHAGGEDSDSDSSDKPGNSDKNDKNDKNDSTDADADTSDTPAKDKAVAAKDKSAKKGKNVAKPAVQPVVAIPDLPVSAPQTTDGGSAAAGDHKAGEVVGVGMTSADVATVSAMGFSVATPAATVTTTPIVEIIVPEGIDEDEARASLAKALPGRRFGLNKMYSGYATANSAAATSGKTSDGPPGADPRCTGDQCYGRAMIGWQAELEGCQAGVSIGMIDTGIDADHPALAGGGLDVRNFTPVGAKEESHGHATGVAALLIGNGHGASPGLLPKARLIAADVFYVDGKHVVTDTASLLRALEWLDEAGVGIVNMSFSGPEDPLVAEAIGRMGKKGVVFVAAAGNNGPGAPSAYPAAYTDVVAVTAVDARMKSYVKANHGDYIDVAAPGVKIWTATANGKSGYQSGTSFAVPFVTAALAASSAFGAPDAAEHWLATAGIDDIGELGIDSVFGRGLLKAPAGCSEAVSGSSFFSAFLPEGNSETTRPVRIKLGMAQR